MHRWSILPFFVAAAFAGTAFANCADGNAVSYCRVEGGGHEWPAAAPSLIWAFLKAHAR